MLNYNWYAAIGYDLLVLTVVRLLWRWVNPTPQLPADTPRWEAIGAHLVHWGLYIVTFAAALTGWALAGTFRTPMTKDVFGIPFPALVGQDRVLHNLFEEWHEALSYLLAAFVIVHALAALRHHYMRRSDVMRRMVWG